MSKPICIDLYACASGSGVGYEMAGFQSYAVENDPKMLKYNPLPHVCMDALEAVVLWNNGEGITFSDGRTIYLKDITLIHASPPCQGYSIMNNLPWIRKRKYPLEIPACRELLTETGKLFVIENVAGAASKKNLEKLGLLEHRLRAGWLCGGMFGLPIYRHRYFETNFFWLQPGHPNHTRTIRPGRGLGDRASLPTYDVYGKGGLLPGQRRPALHLPPVNERKRSHLSEEYKGSWDRYRPENARQTEVPRVLGEDTKETRRRGLTASPPMAGHSPGNAPALAKGAKRTGTPLTLGAAGVPPRNGAQKEGVAVGHAAGWRIAAKAMGVEFITNRQPVTQAIPPVMTVWIGGYALKAGEE